MAGEIYRARRLPQGDLALGFEPGDYQLSRAGNAVWVALPNATFGRLDERWSWSETSSGHLTITPSINEEGGWHGWLQDGWFKSV
jgi:Family of unknown function (DUF6527)